MQHNLKDLADIKSGYTFRKAIKGDTGDYRVLRIKDIRQSDATDNQEQKSPLPRIFWEHTKPPPRLSAGDIALPGRGERHFAMLFDKERINYLTGDDAQGIIPSNQIYTIRIKPGAQRVLPEYLAWFLNRKEARTFFTSRLGGTSIPILSRENLGKLSVSVPSIKTQQKIIELDQLWQEENRLYSELLDNRRRILKGIYNQYLERE